MRNVRKSYKISFLIASKNIVFERNNNNFIISKIKVLLKKTNTHHTIRIIPKSKRKRVVLSVLLQYTDSDYSSLKTRTVNTINTRIRTKIKYGGVKLVLIIHRQKYINNNYNKSNTSLHSIQLYIYSAISSKFNMKHVIVIESCFNNAETFFCLNQIKKESLSA